MNIDFVKLAQSRLSSFLLDKGFEFEGFEDSEESRMCILFYKSDRAKIAIYKSLVDGEVNCKIGSVNANNSEIHNRQQWFYLGSLINEDKNLTFEELLARVPVFPRGPKSNLKRLCKS
jgi:hypothetical protein